MDKPPTRPNHRAGDTQTRPPIDPLRKIKLRYLCRMCGRYFNQDGPAEATVHDLQTLAFQGLAAIRVVDGGKPVIPPTALHICPPDEQAKFERLGLGDFVGAGVLKC